MIHSYRIGLLCGLFAVAVLTLPLNAGEEAKGTGRRGFGTFGGGFPGGGMDKTTLLQMEQVQKELKVTEEQKPKVEAVLAAAREKMRGQRPPGNFKDMTAEEKEKRSKDLQETRKKATEEADKELAKILNAEQMTRLDEITLQQRGVEALKDEKVAKKLELTQDQLKKVDEAIAWGRDEQTKLSEEMRGQGRKADREAFQQNQEKRDKIRKETEAKAVQALTKDQQEKFAKMKGKPFELDRSQMFRGPGGPGGRGGAGKGSGKSEKSTI